MVQWDSVEQLEQYQLHQRNDLPKLGTDSKLLAQFATLHRREKVLDLGCGVGVLVLTRPEDRGETIEAILARFAAWQPAAPALQPIRI